MILDLVVMQALIPFLIFIGIALVIYGKEILDVMSFPIGALSGGILAYMILRGLLFGIEIPIFIEVIVAILFAIGGGMLGKGTMAMLLALFGATVLVDVIMPFAGDVNVVILLVVGLVIFLALVALVHRFMPFFSAFLGGITVAMGITPFMDSLDEPIVRIIQLTIGLSLCVLGGFLQIQIKKKIEKLKEDITWVPKKNPKTS
ncbi:MAG: hypothetical protein ACMUHB_01855 [Thermoplasmatota archaeon]